MSESSVTSGHGGYPAVKKAAPTHYIYPDRYNELLTLGSFFHGPIRDEGGQDDYVITAQMKGAVFILDADGEAGYQSHFYFDKGVEIVGINTRGTGSLQFANGGFIHIAFEEISHFHFGNGKAMTYDEFADVVRAAINDSGSYIVGDYVDFSDIDFDSKSTETISFEGRDESNLMSLGFSQIATARGGGGKDIYRVTRFQSQDVTINDGSADDLVIFEYGVQVAGVSFPAVTFIGGSENAPAMKTLTVNFAPTNVYQIGDDAVLRFKGNEFVTAFSATGLPVDLGLAPHLRETWLGSSDLAKIPDGVGILANLSDGEVELNGNKVNPGYVYFYNGSGLLKDGGDIYGYGIGENAFSGSVHDNNVAGSQGDDFIIGNDSDNRLRGGGGADSFMFAGHFGHDGITDFASGTDTIALNSDATYSISTDGLTVTVTDKADLQAIRGTITLNATVKHSDIALTAPQIVPVPEMSFRFTDFSVKEVENTGADRFLATVTVVVSAQYGDNKFIVPRESISGGDLVFFDDDSGDYLGSGALTGVRFDQSTGNLSGTADMKGVFKNRDADSDFRWVNGEDYRFGVEIQYDKSGTVSTDRSPALSDIITLITNPQFGDHEKFPLAFFENDANGLNDGAGIDLQPQYIPLGGSVEIVGIANGNGVLGETTADDFTLTDDGVLNLTSAGLDRESIGAGISANTATVTVTIGIFDADGGEPTTTTSVAIRVTALNDEYPRIDFSEQLGLKTITVQEGVERLATTPMSIQEYDQGGLPHYTNNRNDAAIRYVQADNPYDSFFSYVEFEGNYYLDVTAATDFESATSDGVTDDGVYKIFHAVFRMYDNGSTAVVGGKEGRDTVTLLVSDVDDEDAFLQTDRGNFSTSTAVGAEIFSLHAEDKDKVSAGDREAFNFSLLSVTLNDAVIADVFSLVSDAAGNQASLRYNGGRALVAGDIYKFTVETEEVDSTNMVTHEVFLTVIDDLI